MPKRKAVAEPDPDKLVREQPGTYRSADGRFVVQEAATGWFLVDSEQTNEFGQPLMHGPFATLAGVRGALPGARKTVALSRGPRSASASAETPAAAPQPEPEEPPEPAPPPPPSWVDRLPPGEAREVRRLIRALEREGLAASEAEALVRRDHEGLVPAVAARLIERRLAALADEVPPEERAAAADLLARAAEELTAGGTSTRGPLPRWLLVEIGPQPEPQNRRIVLRRKRAGRGRT